MRSSIGGWVANGPNDQAEATAMVKRVVRVSIVVGRNETLQISIVDKMRNK